MCCGSESNVLWKIKCVVEVRASAHPVCHLPPELDQIAFFNRLDSCWGSIECKFSLQGNHLSERGVASSLQVAGCRESARAPPPRMPPALGTRSAVLGKPQMCWGSLKRVREASSVLDKCVGEALSVLGKHRVCRGNARARPPRMSPALGTRELSGSEEGSYLRLIDFCITQL